MLDTPSLDIVCLCADWCGTCREYAQVFEALQQALPAHRYRWIDIEDEADALGDIDIETFPTLLVAHGGQGDAPVTALSAEFPDMRFAITQGHWLAPNTACYEVLQEQSAFLAGVLAGLATRTGVVGHLSGEKVRPGLKGRAAFAHGVRSVAPACRFVTTFCGHQHDPALAYRAALALQREGADLVFAMIDGGRDGITQACRETPMRQIGNVLDWVARDPQVFAASAIADSGQGVERAIADFVDGTLRPGTLTRTGLEAPQAVRLVMTPALQQAHGAEIDAWSQRLQSGALVPDETYDGPELQA